MAALPSTAGRGKKKPTSALPGAGILQISSDLKTINLVETPDEMRKVNLHDTNIWYDKDGTPYLVFPANSEGKIFTTSLDGRLVHKLDAPTAAVEFEAQEVHDYFREQREFRAHRRGVFGRPVLRDYRILQT